MINDEAIFIHRAFFWVTPYDTGNLAKSIGDVGSMGGGVGFYMFDRNQVAPYGAILNEAKTIKYRIVKSNGTVSQGEYHNKHYQWVDRGIENIIPSYCIAFGYRRV